MWVQQLRPEMGYSTLAIGLLALVVTVLAESTASPTEPLLNYGDWQLSDFVMKSPSDANRRVYKQAPQFLSQLAPNAAKNDSRAANGKGLTLTKILSDLRAADFAGRDVIPPPSEAASPSLEKTSNAGVAPDIDNYLASESIFVASDVESYDSPVARATNTAYASVTSDNSPQGTEHVNISDHFPSESVIVSSAVKGSNSAAVKPELVLNSKYASPNKPKPVSNQLYDPNPTLRVGSAVGTFNGAGGVVRPPYPLLRSGVANNLKAAPETIVLREKTQVSMKSSNSEVYSDVKMRNANSTSAPTTQFPSGKQELKNPIYRSNTVAKVPTFQNKPVANSTAFKAVNKSPVFSSPYNKLPKAVDKVKYPSNTLKMTKEVETIIPSPSMQVFKEVDTFNSDTNRLDMPKAVDKAKLSNTNKVSDVASNTPDMPKAVDKTKPYNTKQVPDTFDKTKTEMPKAVDKTKPSKIKQVPQTVGKPETASNSLNMPKAVDKSKPSNIMKVPDMVDKTRSDSDTVGIPKEASKQKPSVTLQVPKASDERKPNMWPSVNPSMTKETIPVEKAREQKKKLMDKMLKWTLLLQSQERERQLEYTELLKELHQLQHLEYQVYTQGAYPH